MLIFVFKEKILDKKENLTHKLLYNTKKRPPQTLRYIYIYIYVCVCVTLQST